MSIVNQNQFVRNLGTKPRATMTRKILLQSLFLTIGILAGRIVLLDNMAVGGLGYIIAMCNTPYLPVAFIGSVIGRLTYSTSSIIPLEVIPEVICFTILFVLKKINYSPQYKLAVIIAIISRLPTIFTGDIGYYAIVMFGLSTIILLGVSYSFTKAYDSLKAGDVKPNIVTIMGTIALLLGALPSFDSVQISPMIILSSILIIACAASLGATYASGAGAVAAISIVLSGNGSIEVGGMLAICGLTAGMFIDYGKFVVTSVYIFITMLLSMLYASDVFYIMNWQSLSFCLICGLLLPNSFLYN